MDSKDYEVIVLGMGPAGLQAAIHAARAKTSVLVLGREVKSSIHKAHVENFCCLEMIDGDSLLRAGRSQAEKFGSEFLAEDIIEISKQEDWFVLHTESGGQVRCRALILAMGISRKKLRVHGEAEFLGKGASYCVDCDAGFYRGEPVAVVGNESAAASGALTMLFYADQVHLICKELQVSPDLAHQIRQSDIVLHEGQWVKEIAGTTVVEEVVLLDDSRIKVAGVFIELGAKGAVELAARLGVALDSEKFEFVVTDKKQATNVPGIFAAGDICGPPWQVAKAVGEGCVAGLEAAAFAKKIR